MNILKRLLIGLVGFGAPLLAGAIPITGGFVPGGLSQGNTSVFVQHVYLNFEKNDNGIHRFAGGLPVADNTFLDVRATIVGFANEFHKDGGLFMFIPYFDKKILAPSVGQDDRTRSFGDPVIGGFWRFFARQGFGWFFSPGIVFSVSPPLAEFRIRQSAASSNFAPMPRGIQPGTGNWVMRVASSNFYEDTQKLINLYLEYEQPIKGAGYRHPAVFNYFLSVGYRIYPWKYKSETFYPFTLTGQLELLGTYTGKQSGSARRDAFEGAPEDTKGNIIKLAPGIRLEGTGSLPGAELDFQYQHRLSDSSSGKLPIRFKSAWVIKFLMELG